MNQHPLRDLAAQLLLVTQGHPCYSQAHAVVQNCADHLCALAAYHELIGKLAEHEPKA